MTKTKILCVVGTRPEAIKMAPVILALKNESWANVRVLATAQHRDLLDQVLDAFMIVPDIDLNIMRSNQTLTLLTARLLNSLDDVLTVENPDVVLVQGDTTTVMTVALASFYHNIPVGHIEAGLRTGDMMNPFPEELNRVLTGQLARWHFAPMESSCRNLKREGVDPKSILVTGNTVIDALLMTVAKNPPLDIDLDSKKRLILITSHRRENFGEPLRSICRAIHTLAVNNTNIQFLFPVHPNPNVKDVVYEMLSGVSNIRLCAPLGYKAFVAAMNRSYLIISDSGGIQEEAPALGKPVLVLRDETERQEAIEVGAVKIVGSNYRYIVQEAQLLIDDPVVYQSMVHGKSPYGDGHAAKKIVNKLKTHFDKRIKNDKL